MPLPHFPTDRPHRRLVIRAGAWALGALWMALAAAQTASIPTPPSTTPPAPPAPPASASRPPQDLRFVVFHTPGPAWQAGRSPFEQPGIRAHIAHYRQWLAAGKLQMGGPHLDAQGGGLMIPKAGVTEDEIRRFAEADPAVQSGLLRVTVRPWLIGMEG